MGGKSSKQKSSNNSKTSVVPRKEGPPHLAAISFLLGLDPSEYETLTNELKTNSEAINVLSELVSKLGFIKEEEHVAALLPPELRNFDMLKEDQHVAAALNNPSFLAAQKAMQSTPNDPKNLTSLQNEVTKLIPIYETAIQTRIQEDGIATTCRKVIQAGNEDFEQVYKNMWEMIIKSDKEGGEQTEAAIDDIILPEKSETNNEKSSSLISKCSINTIHVPNMYT